MTGFVSAPRYTRCLICWCKIPRARLLCRRDECWSVSKVWEPKTEWGRLRKAERDEACGDVQEAPITMSVTTEMEERLSTFRRLLNRVPGWFSGILRRRS